MVASINVLALPALVKNWSKIQIFARVIIAREGDDSHLWEIEDDSHLWEIEECVRICMPFRRRGTGIRPPMMAWICSLLHSDRL